MGRIVGMFFCWVLESVSFGRRVLFLVLVKQAVVGWTRPAAHPNPSPQRECQNQLQRADWNQLWQARTIQKQPWLDGTGWNQLRPARTGYDQCRAPLASPHGAGAPLPAPHSRCPTCARGREPGLRVLFLNMCGENAAFPPAAAIWDVCGRKGICTEVPLPCYVASLSGFLKVMRSVGRPSDVRWIRYLLTMKKL